MSEDAHRNPTFGRREKAWLIACFAAMGLATVFIALGILSPITNKSTEHAATAQPSLENQTAAIKARVYEAYALEDAFCRAQPEVGQNNLAYSDAATTHDGTKIHSDIVCYTQDNHAYKYPLDFDQQSHKLNLGAPLVGQTQGPTQPA